MKITKNYKKIYKRYYQWLCICRKNIIIFKLSMAYNIGVVNFAHTCKGQLYGVHHSCRNLLYIPFRLVKLKNEEGNFCLLSKFSNFFFKR